MNGKRITETEFITIKHLLSLGTMSQAEIAKTVGVANSTVSLIFNCGETFEEYQRYVASLHVSKKSLPNKMIAEGKNNEFIGNELTEIANRILDATKDLAALISIIKGEE